MASGRQSHIKGFQGTGADQEIRGVPFKPGYVLVVNVDGLCKLEHFDGMADDSGVKTITDGTISEISLNGITLKADGFDLGADTDVNVSGEAGWILCLEANQEP